MTIKKMKIANDEVEVHAEHDLICVDGGHNKFWQATVVHNANGAFTATVVRDARWAVQIRWGRIGSEGHTENKYFNSQTELNKYLARRLQDKYDKGYKARVTASVGPATTVLAPVAVTYSDWDLL